MSRGGLSPAAWVLAFVVFDVVMVVVVLAFASTDIGGYAIPWRTIATFAAIALVGAIVRLQRR